MARWDPDGRTRLQQAALALYSERGYESTTVAQIAERAGLTERTFFRHFADKREVLFFGSDVMQQQLTDAVASAPESASPLEAATAGIEAAAGLLEERGPQVRTRQAVVAASPELQERELTKLAGLASALAETLRGRGVAGPAAALTAEMALAVFKIAVEQWAQGDSKATLVDVIHESLAELTAVTSQQVRR
ncbi:TetR/AcrR family transcriptional regulator [Luteipulveratus mongoliensis]|uniref:TetR family transcriptional regulator n=1 Tax=Luteipulveratus mongoliensis TaxID=571913 RepID=A0A0K1JFE3_9MICO|nr:TetR/AcrR family transcriptional regulator [Luteipulveratus mongoliensis]AKU15442.1 TetR family transcriptional regulator [Luteipulveratus mongoliensis]